MPVFNCAGFIADAVTSILDQTYADFEFMIIDDCSTDDTCAIVERYDDKRITLIKKETHSGLINSLNLGLSMAKGEYIARMDGDDISYKTRFEKQVAFLNQNQNIALCGTWYRFMHSPDILEYPVSNGDIKIALLDYCCFSHPTMMIRNSFIKKHKFSFDAAFISCEDYDMWTKMAPIGELANIPECLLTYRLHANQITAKDQFNQVKNSNLCRVRMMCYPLKKVTEFDKEICTIIVEKKAAKDILALKKTLYWLDGLSSANQETSFYPQAQLDNYIFNKKLIIARRFYLNETVYNPQVLFGFTKSFRYLKIYFNPTERSKLALKCLFFWNVRKRIED